MVNAKSNIKTEFHKAFWKMAATLKYDFSLSRGWTQLCFCFISVNNLFSREWGNLSIALPCRSRLSMSPSAWYNSVTQPPRRSWCFHILPLYQVVLSVLLVLTNLPKIPILQMVLDLMCLTLHHAKWQEWNESGFHASHVGFVLTALASPSSLEGGTNRSFEWTRCGR